MIPTWDQSSAFAHTSKVTLSKFLTFSELQYSCLSMAFCPIYKITNNDGKGLLEQLAQKRQTINGREVADKSQASRSNYLGFLPWLHHSPVV